MSTIPLLEESALQHLEKSDEIICMEAEEAFCARISLYAAQWTFYNSKTRENVFKIDPLTTFTARLLKSSLEKAAINVYSELSEFNKIAKLKWSNLIGLSELHKHRHFQAHPYTGAFSNEQIRQFVEQNLHHKDDLAFRIWSVRESIIQILLKNKRRTKSPLRIDFNEEAVELIYLMLRS